MEYFNHRAVTMYFKNNFSFYEGAYQSKCDVVKFGKKGLKNLWTGENVVRYLAFGVIHYPKERILSTLNSEFPEWKNAFHERVESWEREGLFQT